MSRFVIIGIRPQAAGSGGTELQPAAPAIAVSPQQGGPGAVAQRGLEGALRARLKTRQIGNRDVPSLAGGNHRFRIPHRDHLVRMAAIEGSRPAQGTVLVPVRQFHGQAGCDGLARTFQQKGLDRPTLCGRDHHHLPAAGAQRHVRRAGMQRHQRGMVALAEAKNRGGGIGHKPGISMPQSLRRQPASSRQPIFTTKMTHQNPSGGTECHSEALVVSNSIPLAARCRCE